MVLGFARMNPPTFTGHGKLVKKIIDTALETGGDQRLYLTKTVDKKKNPLPIDRKLFWARKMFPSAKILPVNDITRTVIEAAKAQSVDYRNLIMVAGSDRVAEYTTLLNKYNGVDYKFESIKVVSSGDRDPDSDDAATGMSATKMRGFAVANDIQSFTKGVPSTFKLAETELLMLEIRSGMGLVEGMSYSDFLQTL